MGGPYADAFQSALFQQQAAAAAAATTQSATNFSLPMNFGGPFQQAALAQHFSQNLSNFATAASPANANTTNNAFINPPASAVTPAAAQNTAPPQHLLLLLHLNLHLLVHSFFWANI